MALISFFFTGAADQSLVQNIPLGDLLINRGAVENWTGVRGAFLADLLMNRLFGLSSFALLFFLGSVGAKLMGLSRVSLIKRFLSCAAILIWGSVFFAFVFISGYEDSFIYLGGQHGYYISEVLVANVGIPGTILVLLGSFMVIAVFMSPKTIPFLQGLFSFGWLERFKRQPGEKPDKVEEPVEEEPREFRPADEEERLFDTEAELEKAEAELAQERRSDPVDQIDEPEVEEKREGTDENFEVTVAKERQRGRIRVREGRRERVGR